MSSFFSNIMTDMKGMEQNVLGPDYLYWKRILKPSDMGMSDDGNFGALTNDVNGLINYVEVLVTGKNGSTTGGPLGDKYFLKTGGQCTDVASGKKVDRYIYIDNIPNGNIPFISSGLGGTDFTEFEGLIPGVIGDLGKLNPLNLFKSFMMGENPDCMSVTLQTVTPVTDANLNDTGKDNTGTQTQFVAVADVKNMDPCIFPDKKNPADPSLTCTKTFTTRNMNIKNNDESSSDNDSNFNNNNCNCHYNCNCHLNNQNHTSYKTKTKLKGYKNFEQKHKYRNKIKNIKNNNFNLAMNDLSKLPDDMYVKAFYILVSVFSLYAFYRFIKRISKTR